MQRLDRKTKSKWAHRIRSNQRIYTLGMYIPRIFCEFEVDIGKEPGQTRLELIRCSEQQREEDAEKDSEMDMDRGGSAETEIVVNPLIEHASI